MRTEDVIDITYEKLTNNQIPLLYLDPDFVFFLALLRPHLHCIFNFKNHTKLTDVKYKAKNLIIL